jgi:hypothetical protein
MDDRLKVRITVEHGSCSGDDHHAQSRPDAPVERLLARSANGVTNVTTLVGAAILVAALLSPATTSSTRTRPGPTRVKIVRPIYPHPTIGLNDTANNTAVRFLPR